MRRYVGRLNSLQESGSGAMDNFMATSHWVVTGRKSKHFCTGEWCDIVILINWLEQDKATPIFREGEAV